MSRKRWRISYTDRGVLREEFVTSEGKAWERANQLTAYRVKLWRWNGHLNMGDGGWELWDTVLPQ